MSHHVIQTTDPKILINVVNHIHNEKLAKELINEVFIANGIFAEFCKKIKSPDGLLDQQQTFEYKAIRERHLESVRTEYENQPWLVKCIKPDYLPNFDERDFASKHLSPLLDQLTEINDQSISHLVFRKLFQFSHDSGFILSTLNGGRRTLYRDSKVDYALLQQLNAKFDGFYPYIQESYISHLATLANLLYAAERKSDYLTLCGQFFKDAEQPIKVENFKCVNSKTGHHSEFNPEQAALIQSLASAGISFNTQTNDLLVIVEEAKPSHLGKRFFLQGDKAGITLIMHCNSYCLNGCDDLLDELIASAEILIDHLVNDPANLENKAEIEIIKSAYLNAKESLGKKWFYDRLSEASSDWLMMVIWASNLLLNSQERLLKITFYAATPEEKFDHLKLARNQLLEISERFAQHPVPKPLMVTAIMEPGLSAEIDNEERKEDEEQSPWHEPGTTPFISPGAINQKLPYEIESSFVAIGSGDCWIQEDDLGLDEESSEIDDSFEQIHQPESMVRSLDEMGSALDSIAKP